MMFGLDQLENSINPNSFDWFRISHQNINDTSIELKNKVFFNEDNQLIQCWLLPYQIIKVFTLKINK
jgi:hypothetical protein